MRLRQYRVTGIPQFPVGQLNGDGECERRRGRGFVIVQLPYLRALSKTGLRLTTPFPNDSIAFSSLPCLLFSPQNAVACQGRQPSPHPPLWILLPLPSLSIPLVKVPNGQPGNRLALKLKRDAGILHTGICCLICISRSERGYFRRKRKSLSRWDSSFPLFVFFPIIFLFSQLVFSET